MLTINCRISKIGFPTFLFQARDKRRTSIEASGPKINLIEIKSMRGNCAGYTWDEKKIDHLIIFNIEY